MLDAEIKEHEAILETLVRAHAPALMDAPGVSTGTVAGMLVVLGDVPQRIRSEAAFASSVASVPCRPRAARPLATASIEVAIAARMLPLPRRARPDAPSRSHPRIHPTANR